MATAISFSNIPTAPLRNLLEHKEIYNFSLLEKFISFFEKIFTGTSGYSEYKQLHDLLYQQKDNPKISELLSFPLLKAGEELSEGATNWLPIIGVAKMIDRTKPENLGQYKFEPRPTGDETFTINITFDDAVLALADCCKDDLEFLKANLFNENDGKIRSDIKLKEGESFYSNFQRQLIEHLTAEEAINIDTEATDSHSPDIAHFNTLTNEPTVELDETDSHSIHENNITHPSILASKQAIESVEPDIYSMHKIGIINPSVLVSERARESVEPDNHSMYKANITTPNIVTNKEVLAAKKDIDLFIEKLATEGNITKESLKNHKSIGSGTYGSVYLFNEKYVVKFPINNSGNMVDSNSPEHGSAHPKRTSYYLNRANNDPDFSRPMQMMFNGKKTDVLVSKYIAGKVFNTDDDANRDRALDELWLQGLFIHDLHVLGNVLIKDDKLFFIDADQIVLSLEKRQEYLELQERLEYLELQDLLKSQEDMEPQERQELQGRLKLLESPECQELLESPKRQKFLESPELQEFLEFLEFQKAMESRDAMKPRERRDSVVSINTKTLEEQVKASLELDVHIAQRNKRQGDIDHFSDILNEHNDLVNAGRTNRGTAMKMASNGE